MNNKINKFINMSSDDYFQNPININNNKLNYFDPLLFTLVVNNQKKNLVYQLKKK